MNGKKTTIVNRANNRPKGNLLHSSGRWVLKKLHSLSVQWAATAGLAAGAYIAGKGGSENLSLVVGGAITAVIAAFAKDTVIWIARRFTIDLQDQYPELESDGWPGPETRVVVNVPKLNADGTPILKAEPIDNP